MGVLARVLRGGGAAAVLIYPMAIPLFMVLVVVAILTDTSTGGPFALPLMLVVATVVGIVYTVLAYAVVGVSTLVASRARRRILMFVVANAVLLLLAVIAGVVVFGVREPAMPTIEALAWSAGIAVVGLPAWAVIASVWFGLRIARGAVRLAENSVDRRDRRRRSMSGAVRSQEWGHNSMLYSREEVRLILRLVRPFYLKMYLVEAPTEVDSSAARRFRRRLIGAGRGLTSEQVEWLLLSGGWRERRALACCRPLAVVSALITGSDVVAGMQSFAARPDGRDDRGTTGFVSAAIAHLGGGSPPFDPDPMVVAAFQDSLKVATDLQSDFRTARRSSWLTSLAGR